MTGENIRPMKTKLARIACLIMSVLCISFVMTGCESKTNIISNAVYFNDTINYSTFASNSKKEASLEKLVLGDNAVSFQYTSIDILGKKKWICGMFIESITYTFETNAETTLELELILTNVKSTTNFNSANDYFYYTTKSSLVVGEDLTASYTFLVNDYIHDTKAPQLLLNIDNICYQTNNTLTLKLKDFKVAGYHVE